MTGTFSISVLIFYLKKKRCFPRGEEVVDLFVDVLLPAGPRQEEE